MFFKSGVLGSDRNLKIQSVALDVEDDNLMIIIGALTVFYFIVTGPYWKVVNSSIPYSQFHTYVQTMYSCFQKWSEDSSDMLEDIHVSVFGKDWSIVSPTISSVKQFIGEKDHAHVSI